jgi:hypothetical protein
MHTRQSGLIVDGVWGEASIVFPFAVYEAKKRSMTYADAARQIYHACQAYLAMLDDLARDPVDVRKYQSKESGAFQLFAFTSCGSAWTVFVAHQMLGRCVRVPGMPAC